MLTGTVRSLWCVLLDKFNVGWRGNSGRMTVDNLLSSNSHTPYRTGEPYLFNIAFTWLFPTTSVFLCIVLPSNIILTITNQDLNLAS